MKYQAEMYHMKKYKSKQKSINMKEKH